MSICGGAMGPPGLQHHRWHLWRPGGLCPSRRRFLLPRLLYVLGLQLPMAQGIRPGLVRWKATEGREKGPKGLQVRTKRGATESASGWEFQDGIVSASARLMCSTRCWGRARSSRRVVGTQSLLATMSYRKLCFSSAKTCMAPRPSLGGTAARWLQALRGIVRVRSNAGNCCIGPTPQPTNRARLDAIGPVSCPNSALVAVLANYGTIWSRLVMTRSVSVAPRTRAAGN